MNQILLVSVLGAAICGFLIFYLSPIARQVGLVDRPTERKRHDTEVPLVGGIVITLTFFLAIILLPISLRGYRMLFFVAAVLLILGVLDDHRDVSAPVKLIMQIFISLILVTMGDKVITDIGDIFHSGVSQGLNILAIPFSVLAIVGIINAVNMIDGQDGLAGLTSIVSFVAIGYLCYRVGRNEPVGILMVLIAVLAVFVLFNVSILGIKRQVFLGDAGSMILGLLLVYFLIDLRDMPVPENYHGMQKVVVKTAATPWIVGLPLFDLFASIVRRIMGLRSPILADRGHVHHRLMDFGYSKVFTVVTLVIVHVIFVSVGVIGTIKNWPDWALFWSPFILLGIYVFYTNLQEKKILDRPWKLD